MFLFALHRSPINLRGSELEEAPPRHPVLLPTYSIWKTKQIVAFYGIGFSFELVYIRDLGRFGFTFDPGFLLVGFGTWFNATYRRRPEP